MSALSEGASGNFETRGTSHAIFADNMAAFTETAKVKLVTIVAGAELLEGLEERLNALNISGYTVTRADGEGVHGVRARGFLGIGNVRIETLAGIDDANQLLARLAHDYEGRALIAFSHDVEAIPRAHFP